MYTENTSPCRRPFEPRVTEGCGCERESDRTDDRKESRCDGTSWGLRGYPIAMVYAPLQSFHGILDPETALRTGTVFGELDLPFLCGGGRKGGGCCD